MKKLLGIVSLLLFTACSERVYEPGMKLKLIDKITKEPIKEVVNTEGIKLGKNGTLTVEKKTHTRIMAPFDGNGPRFISAFIGIAPKGYKPQWCLCNRLNYKEECIARILKFTPEKDVKEMSAEDLEVWIKGEDKKLSIFYKVSRKQSIQKQSATFCSEDPIQVLK